MLALKNLEREKWKTESGQKSDMYDIDEVYGKLQVVLNHNLMNEGKDFFAVYFHLWRYIYCLNQNIEESKGLEDKVALINRFIQDNKEIQEIETAMVARSKFDKKDVPPIEIITFSPHIQGIRDLLAKEQARLARLMKEIKREKTPHSKPVQKPRKRPAKQKWMRS